MDSLEVDDNMAGGIIFLVTFGLGMIYVTFLLTQFLNAHHKSQMKYLNGCFRIKRLEYENFLKEHDIMEYQLYKKQQYWDHFLTLKKYWNHGMTLKRINKVKDIVMEDGFFWDDILSRHGGYEYSPEELKEKDLFNYQHCFGNFAGMLGDIIYRAADKIKMRRKQIKKLKELIKEINKEG